ncbi:hypothetical protein [Paraflavitalea pollutisoli]|uniref:hypothetical protein n=1 Tax=Paraflavitalea pollutisoli TaxID=3034143 RepID=UPI0023ECB9A6|nr:hypothetical protein [Paraflavitalea sp. H1-2-19X]
MEPLINFAEYYKTISDEELLKIVYNPEAYQAIAVAAAREELNSRQLSEEQLASANQAAQSRAAKKQEQTQDLDRKIKQNTRLLLDTIDPQQASDTSPEKMIRLIVIILGVMWLWNTIQVAPRTIDGLDYPSPSLRRINMRSLVIMGIAPVALFFFWLKTKPGWVLLTFLLVYHLLGSILTLPYYFQESVYFNKNSRFLPNLMFTAAMTIFWAGVLYSVCRPGIRKLTTVSPATMWITLAVAAVISLLLP